MIDPLRLAWLRMESALDELGMALIDHDTELSQRCFNLAAQIDDIWGLTSAEVKLQIIDALKGTSHEHMLERL